ncbi:MAG: hypothetical protein J6B07_00035, partial [Opitutales bacterium]|nr:hypothetical protein [Opitutales bacterium]
FTVTERIVGAGGKKATISGEGEYHIYMTKDNSSGSNTPLFLRADTAFTGDTGGVSNKCAFLNSGSTVTVADGKTLSTVGSTLRLKGNVTLNIGEVDDSGNVLSTGTLAIYTKGAYADNNNSWIQAEGEGNKLTISKGSTANIGAFQGIKSTYTSDNDGGIDLVVNGTMNVGYNTRAFGNPFAFWGNNVTVGEFGVINLTDNDQRSGMFVKKSLDNAGTINIVSGHFLYMSNNSVLTLRKGSDIRTNGVASQKDSVIYLQHCDSTNNGNNIIKKGTATVANVKVVLEADQQLGAFALMNEATLTIDLNENSFELGGITVTNGDTYFLILEDFANNCFSVTEGNEFSLVNVQASANSDNIDLYKYIDDLEWITENGRSFLYSASLAVPEPAEWAMIFGAIALIFVTYRKRR